MSDCFVLYLLLTCMKKKTSGADKFTNNTKGRLRSETIAYRCSPAERKELDKRWKLLGYATK